FVRLFPKVTGLRQCIQSLGLALPAFDVLRAMHGAAEQAREEMRTVAAVPQPSGPATLCFDEVTVLGDAGQLLLSDVHFEAGAGRCVGVVGARGSGKTRLVDCALGLIGPAFGAVIADGVPLTSTSRAAWRRAIGYLGQEPVLFSGTLRWNIVWGRTRIDDGAVAEALRAAAAEFDLRLPGGLHAVS